MRELGTLFDLRQALEGFLEEDVRTGDITSNSIAITDQRAVADIVCKSKEVSVLAGVEEAAMTFLICGCKTARIQHKDGALLKSGTRVLRVEGKALAILKAERTALNLLMRMSGIATQTRALVDAVDNKVSILATRKTAPGLRIFDKKAVVAGGGKPHRVALDDMVLIKDNHIKLVGSAEVCIGRARAKLGGSATIECEVSNAREAISAVNAGADIIMLDNFSPRQAKQAIAALEKRRMRKKVRIELSGGITPKNIKKYSSVGADYISLGFLTHSSKAIDFSLEFR